MLQVFLYTFSPAAKSWRVDDFPNKNGGAPADTSCGNSAEAGPGAAISPFRLPHPERSASNALTANTCFCMTALPIGKQKWLKCRSRK